MEWIQFCLLLGLALLASAQTSGDNVRCRGAGGKCQFWDQPCDGGNYIIGYCGLPSYWRCCIKFPDNDDQCTNLGGTCKMVGTGCPNGRFRKGFCSGVAARKCCISYPTNDDRCTAVEGTCQNLNIHCASTFRKDLCSGAADRCCGAKGGCDPSVDLDFKNLEPAANFDEDELLGTWFLTRWYPPSKNQIKDEIWDRSDTMFKKNGQPNTLYALTNGREKNAYSCFDEKQSSLEKVRTGVYRTSAGVTTGTEIISTYVYQTKIFVVEILCVNPSETGCEDHGAYFWSRHKTSRAQDTERGVHIIRSLCYPYMVRYLSTPQSMTCVPPPKSCGGKMKHFWNDGTMKSDDGNCKRMDKTERTCDPSKNNYRTLWADNDFCEKDLMGVWYMVRWYRPMRNYLGREKFDRSLNFYIKDQNKNVIFYDDNFRVRDTNFCAEQLSGNQTKVKNGVYEFPYDLGGVTGPTAVATYVYMTKNFHVELLCFYDSNNTDSCNDVAANFWSRKRHADPADIRKGVKLLENLCYHNLKMFTIPEHTMDCDKQNNKKCVKDGKMKGDESDGMGDDDMCTAAFGTCKWTDKDPCNNGRYVGGKCAGPDNRRCCIRKDDSLCEDADGGCRWKDEGCSGGDWLSGQCAGPPDRVCCVADE